MKKRIQTLFLICAMLLSTASLFACSEQTDPESDGAAETAPAAEEEIVSEEQIAAETEAQSSANI